MNHFSEGNPAPLGATLYSNGVNFSLFAPFATQVDVLLFKNEEDTKPQVYSLFKTYLYWHIFIENCSENQLYGYRIYGEYSPENGHHFDASKVLVDPYAKAIVGSNTRQVATQFGVDNLHRCLKSVVINDTFDWENIQSPAIELKDCIIYEMHTKGFTYHHSSSVNSQGTFRGIVEKLPYLKSLGINTIELMPIFAFDPDDAPEGKTNYWGYSPINFFALHGAYCQSTHPQEQVIEFKEMVKTLHNNGFKIILDVVFNHTTENDYYTDPTYNFRGISNKSYYILDEKGNNKNFSGCGNTLNANHSVVRRMIINSLEYWVQQMHIDGFRFDLASVLSRDEAGNPMENPPILWEIDSHPSFTKTFLIAEPWDAYGLNQSRNFAGDKWGIWNGEFRDITRRFIKGDLGCVQPFVHQFTGSEGIAEGRHFSFSPKRNIHFITAHDGFTLNDWVSYNQKHNEENGENNQDGSNDNFSWNCGTEGNTNDKTLLNLRERLLKNAIVTLFLSHGVPMLLMGDEVKRSQQGNNNSYCIDSEHNYFHWNLLQQNHAYFSFVQKIIALRKRFQTFGVESYYEHQPNTTKPYIIFHGVNLHQPNFEYHSLRIAIEYVYENANEHLFLLYNMHWEEATFQLPAGKWEGLFDTSHDGEIGTTELNYHVTGRSIAGFFRQ